jgi:hypothetical protein
VPVLSVNVTVGVDDDAAFVVSSYEQDVSANEIANPAITSDLNVCFIYCLFILFFT